MAKVLALVVIALGLVNFIWGFLPELSLPRSTTSQGSLSVFSIGPAYVPILLLIAGLLAMAAFLPGEERAPFAVAAVSSGGAIGAIVSLGTQDAVSGFGQVSKGLGAILLVIFGIIQAVVALTAFVIGSGFAPNSRVARQNSGFTGPGVSAPTGATPGAYPAAGPGPAQQYPGQQYPAQPYPGQQYPAQPYPGQQYPAQPYPGQPLPGQPYPGQPYPSQGPSASTGPWGAATELPAHGPSGWRPAAHGAVPPPPAGQAGLGGPAGSEPSRSSGRPSVDARSDDTDPGGIPVIDPGPPSAAESVVPEPGEPPEDRPQPDRDPTRDS